MPYKEQQPTLRGRWLAEQMRRVRKERGLTLIQAGASLGLDHSALARVERAEWPFIPGRVAELLDIYHLFDPRRRAVLLTLDRNATHVNAWEPDPDYLTTDQQPHGPRTDPNRWSNTMPFTEHSRPTVRGQWLAEQMRQLREARNLTLQQVAEHLRFDYSSLGRYERGEFKFKYDDVAALLDLYQIYDDRERDVLLSLALDIRQANNWDLDFTDELPYQPFVNLAWLETRATRINCYATARIPDLLQTRQYAQHLAQPPTGTRKPAATPLASLDTLTQRQQTFRTGTNHLTLVTTQNVLHNHIGDEHVMNHQLAHLEKLRADKRLTIHILPTGHDITARYDTPFTVFHMPDPYPPVAVTQSLAGRLYLEKPRSLRFVAAYQQLQAAALPDTTSRNTITATQRETTKLAATST